MKKYSNIILFLLLSLHVQAQTKVDSLLQKFDQSDYVFVVAHRGDWRNAPENSVDAIKRAINMGVDIVEIDIQMTKDSNFVVIHDKTLDRTTTGKGKVSDYKTDELKKLLLKSGNGIKTYEQIPTLEEALLVCKDRILVNIDKGGTYIKQILPILEKTGTKKQVIIKGKYPLEKVKEEFGDKSGFLYMPIFNVDEKASWKEIEKFQKEFHPIAIEACFQTDEFDELKRFPEIINKGSRIWINTLWDTLCGGHDDEMAMKDMDANWGWILNCGATIIQTDRPSELIEYLKTKVLR